MKVVYHRRFQEVYADDWAAEEGRLDGACRELQGCFDFVEPEAAREEDLRLVHSAGHLEKMKQQGKAYQIALLAAGGAIRAAQLAAAGEKSFALVRPPGHHARPDSKWGFCIFNNIAVAVARLRREDAAQKVLIIDIDLHYGDGTNRIFRDHPDVTYYHAEGSTREEFLDRLEGFLTTAGRHDLTAVSAGFDTHEYDWGFLLKTADYNAIGRMIGEHTHRCCRDRVFGVLEGGYNRHYLGLNIKAFLLGLENREYAPESPSPPPVFR